MVRSRLCAWSGGESAGGVDHAAPVNCQVMLTMCHKERVGEAILRTRIEIFTYSGLRRIAGDLTKAASVAPTSNDPSEQ